jgi:hypothetical protein
MAKSSVIWLVMCWLGLSGCWKSTHHGADDDDTSGDGDADIDGDVDVDVDVDGDADLDGGYHEPDAYVDPGCGDQPPPPWDGEVVWTCDPYTNSGCNVDAGEACYPYIVYPADRCQQEQYGSSCGPAGYGGDGDPCVGTTDCQAGFACFVTGEGTQCLALCSSTGMDRRCAAGLVCLPTDIPEVGACQ